jgi:hypothetical protein
MDTTPKKVAIFIPANSHTDPQSIEFKIGLFVALIDDQISISSTLDNEVEQIVFD